uniref:Aquarius_N domain-containing protein n=1 Tax=Heterorhabditis bacteriophora TaxID=37862 RepID=A0A1I7WBF5_HETBA
MSIVNMINEKRSWLNQTLNFNIKFEFNNSVSSAEHCAIITFLVNCFNSVEQRSVCFSLLQEVDIVREHMSRLTHMSIWVNLEQTQREDLFIGNKVLSKLRKYWSTLLQKIQKQDEMAEQGDEECKRFAFERTFLLGFNWSI